jgi:hypothetical protein
LEFPCTARAVFPERLSNHCQGLRRTSSDICTQSDAVPLSDPSQNHIKPDTRLQIKGRKHQLVRTAAWNFGILTPRICLYCHLLLHRATTTAVQMAAQAWEIMDTHSYNCWWNLSFVVVSTCAPYDIW